MGRGWIRDVSVALLGGLLAASILGTVRAPVGPFHLEVAWHVAPHGQTELAFPPLGEVIAKTHRAPGRLRVTLQSVHFGRLRRFVDESAQDQRIAVETFIPQVHRLSARLAWHLTLCAALGGAASVALARSATRWESRRRRSMHRTLQCVLVGGIVGAMAVGILLSVTRFTYDLDAFRSPTYRGALEEVPWMVQTVQDGLARVEELDTRLRTLSRHVYDMYRRVESLPPPMNLHEADVLILHVSDFHNHPTAAGLVVELAKAFGVDLVLNTGDLTDFGTRLEATLLSDLEQLDVPHYLVSGNHESPEVLEHIARLPYIELIDGRVVEGAGLRIAAVGDPGALVESAKALTPAQARAYAEQITDALQNTPHRPDVLALHNHRVAQAIAPGLVPLIVFGHSHTPSVHFKEGTAYVNAGTTGGAGIRGIEATRTVPITMSLIHLRRGDNAVRVVAVDMVELSPVAGGFVVERHIAPLP